jgi:hypothetical protein
VYPAEEIELLFSLLSDPCYSKTKGRYYSVGVSGENARGGMGFETIINNCEQPRMAGVFGMLSLSVIRQLLCLGYVFSSNTLKSWFGLTVERILGSNQLRLTKLLTN